MSAIKMFGYEAAQQTEYQTKKWATKEEMQALSSGDEQRDVILAQGATVAFYEDDKHWETSVSNNVFAFGGTGSGKTASFILPNLLNHHECCYVVTDTKGELLRRTGKGFEDDGYEVTVLDTVNPEQSAGYDPLRYVMDVEDIPTTVAAIMEGVDPDRRSFRYDPFWDNANDLLLRAIVGILYLLECLAGTLAPGEDPNASRRYLKMNNVFKLAALIKVTGDGEGRFPLDYLVEQVESKEFLDKYGAVNADLYGVEQYRDFRGAADRTLKSILITLNATISRLKTPQLMRVFENDEMRLDRIGEGKRVIDLKVSDNDSANAWLANVALKQLFNLAQRRADASPSGHLQHRVQFVLDEFPNVGRIPDFERSIATVRSRGISFLMCAQSLSQIYGVYGESTALTILDNCDSLVYMGGGSNIATQNYISELCGESVLGTNYVGAERTAVDVRGCVMTPGEVGLMPRPDCLVKVTGMRPFRAKKYFCDDHPNAAKWLRD